MDAEAILLTLSVAAALIKKKKKINLRKQNNLTINQVLELQSGMVEVPVTFLVCSIIKKMTKR